MTEEFSDDFLKELQRYLNSSSYDGEGNRRPVSSPWSIVSCERSPDRTVIWIDFENSGTQVRAVLRASDFGGEAEALNEVNYSSLSNEVFAAAVALEEHVYSQSPGFLQLTIPPS